MEYRLTQEFLAKAVAARTGAEAEDALRTAKAFVEIAMAMNLITAARIEANEESAKIYQLRTDGHMEVPLIAKRFNLHRTTCHQRIKGYLLLTRKVG